MTAAADPVDAVVAAELLDAQPPVLDRPGALAEIRERIQSRGRLLVIDDDPTGTQSVHGVPVLTAWSREDLAGAMQDAQTVFVLTNSRSLPEHEATVVSTEITERAAAIAAEEGFELAVASRSDSTMRGHFPQEPGAVADALEAAGHTVDGLLVCPCFLEAGRYTIDDVQWVAENDRLVPSATTTSRSAYSVALTTTGRRAAAPARISRTRSGPPRRMSSRPRLSTSSARTAPPVFSSTQRLRFEAA